MPIIKKETKEVKRFMNLFKKHYPTARKELWNFKNPVAASVSAGTDDIGALEGKLNSLKWNKLIHEYLDMCDDDQKKFIDLLYFKKHPILEVALMLPMGLRTCQEWREGTLKNVLLLAAADGLLCS